jgi:hypothetical protein
MTVPARRQRRDRAMVAAYLNSSPARARRRFETFHLYWDLGLSATAIAAKLGITPQAAEQRVRRLRHAARAFLRRLPCPRPR